MIENQNKLLKPILSRFCNIFIKLPSINGKSTSLHLYKQQFTTSKYKKLNAKRTEWLKKQLEKKTNYSNNEKCLAFAMKLYEKAYSALDIMSYIQHNEQIEHKRKYASLIYFDKVRKEFRNEILLMSFIINIVFMRPELCLENIQEM